MPWLDSPRVVTHGNVNIFRFHLRVFQLRHGRRRTAMFQGVDGVGHGVETPEIQRLKIRIFRLRPVLRRRPISSLHAHWGSSFWSGDVQQSAPDVPFCLFCTGIWVRSMEIHETPKTSQLQQNSH